MFNTFYIGICENETGGIFMKVLYSNMLPLGIQDNQETIDESIKKQIAKSDRVDIAVG